MIDIKINRSDVKGVYVAGQLLCNDCVSDDDFENAEATDFELEDESQDDLIFCDVCNKRIA